MIKMTERCVCGILAILMAFLLMVSCAATPSDGAVSESEEGAHVVAELAKGTITTTAQESYSIKEAAAYDYVIVTTNSVITGLNIAKLYDGIPNLDDFVQYLENNQGHSVKIITEDDYGPAEGQQRAVNIRNWLVDNYQALGTEYVLLIGNPDPDDPTNATDSYGDIPMMMCWPLKDIEQDYEGCPTDHFYADLTGNWDRDGDGYFGEYRGDGGVGGVNFTSEVYVGRIPVYDDDYQTLAEILKKTMEYWITYGSWRKKALIPVAISNYENENGEGHHRTDGLQMPMHVIEDILIPASFNYYYVLYEGKGKDPVPETAPYFSAALNKENVIKEWKNRYGIVFWWGHGSNESVFMHYWGRYLHGDKNDNTIPEHHPDYDPGYTEMSRPSFFSSTDCGGLLNRGNDAHPSFVFQSSCLNGYPENSTNLGYSLLKEGAIATVSASRSSFYRPSIYTTGVWEPDGYPDNTEIGYEYVRRLVENKSAGEALYDAIASFNISNCGNWLNFMVFNLYGEPSIGLYMGMYQQTLGKTIYVDDDKQDYPDADYEIIQHAIHAASPGDTIIVYPGTYKEQVDVNRKLSLKGIDYPVIDGFGSGHTITMSAGGCVFDGFKVTNSGGKDSAGIYVRSEDNIIKNNIVNSHDYYGIYLYHSICNTIINNTANSNGDHGISLKYSEKNTIANNTAKRTRNYKYGIHLYRSNNNVVTNNNVSNNYDGIRLYDSSNNTIISNTANSNSKVGIYLLGSEKNRIINNTANSNKDDGIRLSDAMLSGGLYGYSCNNILKDNTVLNNHHGICISGMSKNNIITNNIASNNRASIDLIHSKGNIIYLNNFIKNGHWNVLSYRLNIWNSTEKITYIYKGRTHESYMGNYWNDYTGSDADNDGIGDKPYRINSDINDEYPLMEPFENYFEAVPRSKPTPAPSPTPSPHQQPVHNLNTGEDFSTIQAAINDSDTIDGHTLAVDAGTYTENVVVNKQLTIKSTTGNPADTVVQAKNSDDTVFKVTEDYVNIAGFTIENATGSYKAGIYLYRVDHCNISNNNVKNNYYGIRLYASGNSIINGNSALNNDNGIYLSFSSNNNTLTNNIVSFNNDEGIILSYSSNNTLTKNMMFENRHNFAIYGSKLAHYLHHIGTSNKVDEKPIYYWVDKQDQQIPSDAGFIGLVNSTNIAVRDLILKNNSKGLLLAYSRNSKVENVKTLNNWYGIYVYHSDNNTLINCTASNNYDGIYLAYSNKNSITNNKANSNDKYGIHLSSSSNNMIYLNDFINNRNNTYSYKSTNFFNSSSERRYTFNGHTYTNHMGNYWSDYNGNDADKDGICDTPYSIDFGNDEYPLMQSFEHYFMLAIKSQEGHRCKSKNI
jgi:parallel beta-helix repeat protein